ncbi:hypothetical protein REPUB_Repub07fG0211300 [Reevesia pubescens]
MESKPFFRFLLFFVAIAFLLLFTWIYLPYATPPDVTTLLDCASNSPWCTSKNRVQSKQPILTKMPRATTSSKPRPHESTVPRHPLDPLTIQELNKVRTILSSHALFKSSKSYALHSVVLEEPDKELVLKWEKRRTTFTQNSLRHRTCQRRVTRANGQLGHQQSQRPQHSSSDRLPDYDDRGHDIRHLGSIFERQVQPYDHPTRR